MRGSGQTLGVKTQTRSSELTVPMATQLIGGNGCSCGRYGNTSYDFSMLQVRRGAPSGGGVPVLVVISTLAD